jgi:hypothetical protein
MRDLQRRKIRDKPASARGCRRLEKGELEDAVEGEENKLEMLQNNRQDPSRWLTYSGVLSAALARAIERR